jgi:hypothetical protein
MYEDPINFSCHFDGHYHLDKIEIELLQLLMSDQKLFRQQYTIGPQPSMCLIYDMI